MFTSLLPKGLYYCPDFINAAEEALLLQAVDSSAWLQDLKRRVQHYGFRYDYQKRAIDPTMHLGALPAWAMPLAERLYQTGLLRQLPDQLIVNEYLPGQGISAHVDCAPCFADGIASITLSSGCTMDFARAEERLGHFLEARSAVLLTQEARYQWTHAIRPVKSDLVQNRRIPRARRVSLTFRKAIVVTNE